MFSPQSFNGSIGPSFQWNILNYGRLLNNVRYQDARFKELVLTYQSTVLQAEADVENGMATFLQSQTQEKLLRRPWRPAQGAVDVDKALYEQGRIAFIDFRTDMATLYQQENAMAQSQGQIAQGLIAVYRALGGGWEIRLPCKQPPVGPPLAAPPELPKALEEIPRPPAAPGVTPPGTAPEPPPMPELLPKLPASSPAGR